MPGTAKTSRAESPNPMTAPTWCPQPLHTRRTATLPWTKLAFGVVKSERVDNAKGRTKDTSLLTQQMVFSAERANDGLTLPPAWTVTLVLSSQVPSDGVSIIRHALERLSSTGSRESAALAAVRERAHQSLMLAAPHGVYRLARSRPRISMGVAVLGDGGATVHAAADAIVGPDGASRFGGFHFGPFARATAEAICDLRGRIAARRAPRRLRAAFAERAGRKSDCIDEVVRRFESSRSYGAF